MFNNLSQVKQNGNLDHLSKSNFYIKGIDLVAGGRVKNRGIRQTTSSNTYLKLLIKVNYT